ncbi:hypothetical protein AB0L82_36005 [Nocardia sp. NPDC052001]|uniref:hypothetical protein n=1 Tax=Nocardia sp. NPDC052001 TaxID=3154853 RepID=UPI00341D8C3B
MSTPDQSQQPTHVEFTVRGNGFRSVLILSLDYLTDGTAQSVATDLQPALVRTVHAYTGLRCEHIYSVRMMRYDADQGHYVATTPGPLPYLLSELAPALPGDPPALNLIACNITDVQWDTEQGRVQWPAARAFGILNQDTGALVADETGPLYWTAKATAAEIAQNIATSPNSVSAWITPVPGTFCPPPTPAARSGHDSTH